MAMPASRSGGARAYQDYQEMPTAQN